MEILEMDKMGWGWLRWWVDGCVAKDQCQCTCGTWVLWRMMGEGLEGWLKSASSPSPMPCLPGAEPVPLRDRRAEQWRGEDS